MKIAVCVKQVPVVSLLKFDQETRRVVREGVPSEVNPFDVLAMSAAVEIKQAVPGEVVVVTMGPPQAREALVQCLAMGADRAVHLVDRRFAGSDTLATARALSMALRRENFDLVICGRNSVDAETSQVGPAVAEMLGLPQVTAVRRLELSDSGKAVTLERITDAGYEVVHVRLPALITVTEGVAPEVYPSNDAMDAAKSMPLTEVAAADLSDDASLFGLEGSPTSVSEIYSVEPDRDRILVRDEPPEKAVASLLEYLEQRGLLAAEKQDADPNGGVARGPRTRSEESGAIWVVSEMMAEKMRPVTLELLGKARELAPAASAGVEALLIGSGVHGHIPKLTAYGADRVYVADRPDLDRYDTELYTAIVEIAVRTYRPYAVLFPSTANGRDLAARLAARMGLGLTGDCVGLEMDAEGRLVQLKPAFGGNIVAPILSRTVPQMATVRPGILTPVVPDESVEPIVEALAVPGPDRPRVRVLESVVETSPDEAELETARTIVALGMGIGGPEKIPLIRELAETLDGTLGTTRDVVEAGWLPAQLQIGLSGKSVAPDLYIAVGVRGNFNHTVGILKAGTVVAVNNSARAPIFRAADFGILADYAEVVPALISAVKERRRRT